MSDTEHDSGFASAFDTPLAGVRWTRNFEMLDAHAPWTDAHRQMTHSTAGWFLVMRFGGSCRYVWSRAELAAALAKGSPSEPVPLEALLDLHESDVSPWVATGQQPSTPSLPPGAAPSRARFVEVNDQGDPVAVGGIGVTAARRTRGARRSAPDDLMAGAEPPESPESPSGSTSAGAPAAAPTERLDDEGTTPVRHPSIEPEGTLHAGQNITLVVDLRQQVSPSTEGGALRLAELPSTWDTMALGVTLVSAGIEFEQQGRGEVVIQRNRASVVARLRGTVDATLQPGDEIEVHAQFWQGRRSCGSAVRRLTVDAAAPRATRGRRSAAPAAATAKTPTAVQPTVGQISVDPLAAEPDLTVYITVFDPDKPGRLHWRMEMPDFDERPPKLSGVINLGKDPRAEAVAMFKEFAKLKRGQHRERIEGFGERLWKRAPPEFQAAYWALVDHYKPRLTIQFVSDDPHLPWELMRPSRPGEKHEPLALRHAVARWIGAYQGWLRNRLPKGEVVVVAPRYSTLATKLSKAEDTARQVLENGGPGKAYAARGCPGTREALLDLLEHPPATPVALLYFTGHGLFNDQMPSASALKLEQGASLAADEVDREEVALGTRDGTVVFFNACEVGATGGAIGEVGGWASALAARRFRAFIAPLWAVDEEDAAQATLQLIQQMMVQRQTIGEALRQLRTDQGAVSPTFYSYILYGDVTARFAA